MYITHIFLYFFSRFKSFIQLYTNTERTLYSNNALGESLQTVQHECSNTRNTASAGKTENQAVSKQYQFNLAEN